VTCDSAADQDRPVDHTHAHRRWSRRCRGARHKAARETVSIDQLSGGRLVFGAGIGSGTNQCDDLGDVADHKARGAILDEGLEVLAGLWGGETFSYGSTYYHVHSARFLLTPAQSPRIPAWVGGFSPGKARSLQGVRSVE
jgi:alkanesulfonate monooxygenase SsuD/methylene tetrahydromethanopterin reductase-like flavin-dependent oxidoreductase (luciferase family)